MSKIYRPVIPIWIEEEDMRLIDAEHLTKWILSWWEQTSPTSEYLKGADILAQIDRETTIDAVEVVHGEWIGYNADKGSDWLRSDGEPIFLVCNKCHGVVMNNASVNWNFCPNCGAKMGTACTHVEEGE